MSGMSAINSVVAQKNLPRGRILIIRLFFSINARCLEIENLKDHIWPTGVGISIG